MYQFKFSLPLYPDLSEDFLKKKIIPFLITNKDFIFDLYFTSRIPPFDQDAMGTIFSDDDIATMIANALMIKQITGIDISATFNNKFISPNKENHDIFLKNFKQLYDIGVRSATIPFTSWLMFGEIQKEFPELFIKNTVLWKIDEPREVYDAFMNGFNYINLDRNLMRNQVKLHRIDQARKKAEDKLGKKLYLSILYNENCVGNCPIQEEHFLYNVNNNIRKQEKVFFKSDMSNISCYEWEKNDPTYKLKKSNIISNSVFLKDLNIIDVFKLHGRESKMAFLNSLEIIKAFSKDELPVDEFEYIKRLKKISDTDFNEWVKITKNCNFDCWDCNECENLLKKYK